MIGPLSFSVQEKFMRGNFSPLNNSGATVDDYCMTFPDRLLPEFLTIETVIYSISHYYGSTHIAIDFGS
jgi:hypothetical protein